MVEGDGSVNDGAVAGSGGSIHGIFISYRRDDSSAWAGRLYDRLDAHFGEATVFMDVEGIAPGIDFRTAIQQTLDRCEVVLVIIGPTWLDSRDDDGEARLDDEDDFVRLEIQRGLEDERNRIIPVLVGGAAMPRARDLPDAIRDLAHRNAFPLSTNRFGRDVDLLIEELDKIPGRPSLSEAAAATAPAPTVAEPGDPEVEAADPAAEPAPEPASITSPVETAQTDTRSRVAMMAVGAVVAVLAVIIAIVAFTSDDDSGDEADDVVSTTGDDDVDGSASTATDDGDLGLATPIGNRPCDDGYLMIYASIWGPTDPTPAVDDFLVIGSVYAEEGLIEPDLGPSYALTRASCSALVPEIDGSDVYVTYLGPFDDVELACSEQLFFSDYLVELGGGLPEPYVRQMSTDVAPGDDVNCDVG